MTTTMIPTKQHGKKQIPKKDSKKSKKNDKIDQLKKAHEEVQDILLMKWKEHFSSVKPLRAEKKALQSHVIDTKLEEFNFHTYETHSVEDLLSDMDVGSEEDAVIDDAFDDFLS